MGDEGKAVSFPRLTALLFEATAAGNSSLSYCAFQLPRFGQIHLQNLSGYAGSGESHANYVALSDSDLSGL